MIYSPVGGSHHGFPDCAAANCYLNDPVLAILSLCASGLRRIPYVDIDAQHADGVEHACAGDTDFLVISVYQERRWLFTGIPEDRGAGEVWNLLVPRGLNDSQMTLVRDVLILPRLQGFRPESVVLQCVAYSVEENPMSRLVLSKNAHWAVVPAVRAITDRLLVLGSGGCNPWSTWRLWTEALAVLNGSGITERLPTRGEPVLRGLDLRGQSRSKSPREYWLTKLRVAPREGAVRDEFRGRVEAFADRAGGED